MYRGNDLPFKVLVSCFFSLFQFLFTRQTNSIPGLNLEQNFRTSTISTNKLLFANIDCIDWLLIADWQSVTDFY